MVEGRLAQVERRIVPNLVRRVSLLNRGTDVVTVYPEEFMIDSDGNKRTKPSAVGVVCRAAIQPISTSENENAG